MGTRVLVDSEKLEKSRVGTHHWNTHNLHRKVLLSKEAQKKTY